jgi:hypothetical protein
MSSSCQVIMDWRLHGLLYGLLIAIGVAGGFYFATALQKQIEALIGAAVVIGFLTWLGSGADLLGLLREWFKEKREEERIPQLVFDGFTRSDELFMRGGRLNYISILTLLEYERLLVTVMLSSVKAFLQ